MSLHGHHAASLLNGQFVHKYLSKLILRAGYCSFIMGHLQNGNQTHLKQNARSHYSLIAWC